MCVCVCGVRPTSAICDRDWHTRPYDHDLYFVWAHNHTLYTAIPLIAFTVFITLSVNIFLVSRHGTSCHLLSHIGYFGFVLGL